MKLKGKKVKSRMQTCSDHGKIEWGEMEEHIEWGIRDS